MQFTAQVTQFTIVNGKKKKDIKYHLIYSNLFNKHKTPNYSKQQE